jgi:hypothetical protein
MTKPDRETPAMRQQITFDWASKRLLRSKSNFDILEGIFSFPRSGVGIPSN